MRCVAATLLALALVVLSACDPGEVGTTPPTGGSGGSGSEAISPPHGVANLSATADDGQITLAWTNPEPDSFEQVLIYRSTAGWVAQPVEQPNSEYALIYQGAGTGYVDSGVDNLRTYYYSVFTQSHCSGLLCFSTASTLDTYAYPRTGPWTLRSRLASTRTLQTAVAVNGQVRVFGGEYVGPDHTPNDTEERYDPLTDTVTGPTETRIAGNEAASAAVNGLVYILGGNAYSNGADPVNDVHVSDASGSAWMAVSPLPTPRFALSTAVVDGQLYAIGGCTVGNQRLATVEAYDPAGDRWTSKASLPVGRCWHSSVVVDGRIFVLGGYGDDGSWLNDILAYDPAGDSWQPVGTIPSAAMFFDQAAAVGTTIYTTFSSLNGEFRRMMAYDTVRGVWSEKTPAPSGRHEHSLVAVGSDLYVLAGRFDRSDLQYYFIERYDTTLEP